MHRKPNPELIDDDAPEATDKWFAKARPAVEVLPALFGNDTANELLKPKRGRPFSANRKEHVNIRLDAKYDKTVLKSRLDELRDDTNTTNIGFSYYDKETFFHRRHISSLQSISASAALGDAEIKKIRRELAAFVDEHGELLVEQCAAAGDQPLR